MSDMPTAPQVPEVNNPSPVEPNQSTTAKNQYNPIYLWQHKRWLFVAFASGIAILLLGLGLIALTIYSQFTSKSPDQEPAANQSDNKQSTTHDSSDDEFFAQQSQTVLYYSFAQTTGSKNMIQATLSDQENRALNIGYPDKYQFLTSPDGKWLLRWDDQTIERAAATTPQRFNSIFEADNDEQKISSVVWQGDAAAIAIASSQVDGESQNDSQRNQVAVLPLLTLQSVLVYDQSNTFNLELVKFPSANKLYFVENLNGVKRNLTLYNTQSKQVDKQYPTFNQNSILSKLQFSTSMQWAFSTTETQVLRYNLETMEQSVVYTTNRQCEIGNPNNNTIAHASIAPSASKLLVTENLTQCPRKPRNQNAQPTPIPPTRQTTVYSITDSKNLHREYNLDLPQLNSSSWSPNEDYVWLTVDSQKAFIAAVNNLSLSPIPTPERQSITKERVFIIGWLQPKNKE